MLAYYSNRKQQSFSKSNFERRTD